MAAEVPGLLREVLQRDVLDLRGRLDEDLDDRVRVRDGVGSGRGEILDHREARALLGDDHHAPVERAAVRRHLDVERLVDLDALRHADEQAVLPAREVLERELVVVGDQLRRVVRRQRLEGDPLGRADDLDPALGDDGAAGDLEVEHRLSRTCPGDSPWDLSVRAEAAQRREAPVLVLRRRQGQLVEPLRGLDRASAWCS